MIKVCFPACDSLYFSFWARLTPDFRQFIDNIVNDVSTRKKLHAKNDPNHGIQLQLCEDHQSVISGLRSGMKGYTNTVCRVDGLAPEFCGWTMGISEPESMPDKAEHDGLMVTGKADQCDYHRITIAMGSALMHGLLRAGMTAFSALYWWLKKAEGYLIEVRPRLEHIKINRIDICVDHWGCNWDMYDSDEFSRRGDCKQVSAKELPEKYKNNDSTDVHIIQSRAITIYIGRRGSAYRFLRIYNKICELEANDSKKKTEIFEARWRAYGWDGKETVWRAEVEHGGEWLKNHGAKSAVFLKGIERALWEDYTQKIQHKKITRTRLKNCKTSRKWKKLQKAGEMADPGMWKFQSRPKPAGNIEQLKKMAAGIVDNMAESMINQIPLSMGGHKNPTKAQRREAALSIILHELADRDNETIDALLIAIEQGKVAG